MKKARIIKIIKSRSEQPVQAVSQHKENSIAKSEERGHAKAVEGWISEHQERRLVAEQIALKLLYDPMHADKLKDEFSNC